MAFSRDVHMTSCLYTGPINFLCCFFERIYCEIFLKQTKRSFGKMRRHQMSKLRATSTWQSWALDVDRVSKQKKCYTKNTLQAKATFSPISPPQTWNMSHGERDQMDVDDAEQWCAVCGAKSSGYHYGAYTCEGCKSFFKRTIHRDLKEKYECINYDDQCTVDTNTRAHCQFCRFKKCLEVGMVEEGTTLEIF